MVFTEDGIKVLMMGLLFISAQFYKEAFPEDFDKNKKWITWAVVLVGAFLSYLMFLAANAPIHGPNVFSIILTLVTQAIVAVVWGASAVGLYSVGNATLPNVVRSADTILVAKTALTVSGEAAVETPSEEVKTVTVKSRRKPADLKITQ
jgi:cytochrome bd-type quinol oxidase subunit 1